MFIAKQYYGLKIRILLQGGSIEIIQNQVILHCAFAVWFIYLKVVFVLEVYDK